MADEEDPWGFDDGAGEEQAASASSNQATNPPSKAPSVAPSDHKSDSVAVGGTPANEEAAPVEEEAPLPPPPPPEDDGYRKPVQLYRHWVRLVLNILFLTEFYFLTYVI